MTPLSITRIANASVLLELGDQVVLTDPYFDDHWFMRLREPIGMKVRQLPKLAAIVGGHGVFDHWQPGSLAEYPFKQETPVFVATAPMMKKAKAAGFRNVEVLEWSAKRRISDRLSIEVAPPQTAAGMKVNNYVLSVHGLRVFVGTEARDLEPLRRYRELHPAVDVALLPIDGSAILGHKLVMTSSEAVEASGILGAKVLVPIHYALKPIPLLLQTRSSAATLARLPPDAPDLDIVLLETGRRWTWPDGSPEEERDPTRS
jgi:L-ascorbate metabolism protein UlaG (beta-lactamase superfamily)